jgi:hypothetical protein
MHGSRSKAPSKKSLPCIYDVKFLALLGASYIYDISRLRVKAYNTHQNFFCVVPPEDGKVVPETFRGFKPE